jgi:hypothetical protein
VFDFYLKKLNVQVLISNSHQDIMQGLRQRLGSFGPEQVDFEIRYRDTPFLSLELTKLGVMHLSNKTEKVFSVNLREVSLVNVEKVSFPQSIIRSSNSQADDYFFGDVQNSNKKSKPVPAYRDLEDEDEIQGQLDEETLDDFFIRVSH